MAAFNLVNQHFENVYEGVHNIATDTITVAFCAAANAPVATNSLLADLTTVSTTGASSLNVVLGSSSQVTPGVYGAFFSNLVVSATGANIGPFRYVVLYNSSTTALVNPLIGWIDTGGDQTILDGSSGTVTFDQTNGVIRHNVAP